MPRTLSSSRSKEHAAQLTLLAFHEGVLNGAQLRRCVRVWVEDTDSSLEEILESELAGDEELLASLKLQLANFHPEHALQGPHFSFDAHQPPEQLVDAPTSVHNSVVSDSIDSRHDDQRLGDEEELSKKSQHNKARNSRGDRFDYYDSVHEKFTRDERLMPYLVQSALAYRRKLVMDVRRFWRSTKSLIQNSLEWFRQNRRNAILASVGILLFVPACYFLSQFISPNRSRPERLASQGSSQTAPQPTLNDEQTLDVSSLGLDEVDPASAADDLSKEAIDLQPPTNNLSAPLDSPELPGPRSDNSFSDNTLAEANDATELAAALPEVGVGTASAIDPAMRPRATAAALNEGDSFTSKAAEAIPDSVAEPKLEPTDEELLAAELKRGSELLDRRQFGRASMILKSARLSQANSKELCQMLAVALLASQSVDQAGELLVESQFADAEDPVWQALFTCWLLQSSEASRASVKGELLTLVSLRPSTDIIKRCVAWIDARDGRHRDAGPVLLPEPMFSERSFADALFFCVTLNGVGKPQLARKQLEYAKSSYAAVDKEIRQTVEPKSPAMYAIRFVSTTVNSTLNSFDAKLR